MAATHGERECVYDDRDIGASAPDAEMAAYEEAAVDEDRGDRKGLVVVEAEVVGFQPDVG